jgi:hypothetical protein
MSRQSGAVHRVGPWLVLIAAMSLWGAAGLRSAWRAPHHDLAPLRVGARLVKDGGIRHLYDHSTVTYTAPAGSPFSRRV